MKATELSAKLASDASETLAKVRALEAERERLLEAKLAGDPRAMARSRAIRTELEDLAEQQREIAQLRARLAPRMTREEADDARQARAKAAQEQSVLLEAIVERGAAIDRAAKALAAAVKAVAPLMDEARRRGAELVVSTSLDSESRAAMRMVHFDTVMPELDELVMSRLKAVGALQMPAGHKWNLEPIERVLRYWAQSLTQRIDDRLKVDRQSADAAAVEAEEELQAQAQAAARVAALAAA